MRKLLEARTTLDAATAMREMGWEPIPLKPRDKKPAAEWKQPRTWTSENLGLAFGQNANIGVALGTRSGNLLDFDFDWPEAARIGDALLPSLPAFGRASAPRSHRLAIGLLPGKENRRTFSLTADEAGALGLERATVLEIRGTQHQTMMPPSIHPSGERVVWMTELTTLPDLEQPTRVGGLIAFLAVVLKYYPREPGQRDDVCLSLAGALVRAGLSDDAVDQAVSLVARLAGDEEASQRGRKAANAQARLSAGEAVRGLPDLCDRLSIVKLETRLRSWLGYEAGGVTSVRTSDEIMVLQGELPRIVDQAEHALMQAGATIYQRGDGLVRPVRLPALSADEGIRRHAGQVVIHPVAVPWLREQLDRSASWWTPGGENKPNRRIDAPRKVAEQYMARAGSWSLPPLVAIVQSPTLRADGSVLQAVGYDTESGILYDPGTAEFPSIPDMPSREEAEQALQLLEHPFREVSFADEASRSVVTAAVLTALTRRTISNAPLFVFDAPAAGTGKTMIAETIGIIASGTSPAMMAQGQNEEETEKRLSAVLMAGDTMLVIDNCEQPIGGQFLNGMLTATTTQVRVLGKSQMVSVPSSVMMIATGNNVQLVGDLTRRTVKARLDAGIESPETREFDFDPRDEARSQRPQLVAAGLVVLRAYVAAGRPVSVPTMGSFDGWSFIREALVWLGRPDPVETRKELVDADPLRAELGQLLTAIAKTFGTGVRLTAAEMLAHERGQAVIDTLSDGPSRLSSRSLGKRLARHVGRPLDNLVLRRAGDASRAQTYWVENLVAPTVASPPTIDEEFPF